MREITVATVQMKPELGNSENNLVKMSDFVSKITSQQKVDLIVFPELVTSGYELGVRFTELAQRVPGPAINLMAQRAADAGVYIAFGLVTKEKVESILYNSAVLVGPEGELLGAYHKVHLRGEERMAFREGFKLPVIDTGEIGKVGLMLGWDLAFPEVSRAMTLDGAELLCVMANWESNSMDEWKTYVRARAYENALFVAAANRVGSDVTMRFGGESMIVGPRGRIYASLENEPELKKALEAPKAAATTTTTSKEPASAAVPAASGATPATAPAPQAEGSVSAGTPAASAASAASAAGKKAEGPKGTDTSTEGYCVARIDLDEVRRYREEFQTLQARQPTVYKAVVRRY
ncbi:MAG TPA: carbon-nitrogen hydrolase family protein [Aggregatilineales bacterium]|nr:carbon-nitrogen hydrolase family protein [Aggregatilineales bacterium]